ncbi:MAG: hypothetical protein E6Q97_09500 [Desulfurellales bacterium]|nr:MAG: hypothetical protein E6Q97_09500 [Desulfurellales bacterium]
MLISPRFPFPAIPGIGQQAQRPARRRRREQAERSAGGWSYAERYRTWERQQEQERREVRQDISPTPAAPPPAPLAVSGVICAGVAELEDDYPTVFDVEGLSLAECVPILLSHDHDRRVGHLTHTRRTGGGLAFWGVISDPSIACRRWGASPAIGWARADRVLSSELPPGPGGRAIVNGREVSLAMVVRRGVLLEVSLTHCPADSSAYAVVTPFSPDLFPIAR